MKKSLLFLSIFFVLYACSKSNEENEPNAKDEKEVLGEEEEENEQVSTTEIFSLKIDVIGSYFNENFTWNLYLSDSTGVLLNEIELQNNTLNTLESEIAMNSDYDLTLLERRTSELAFDIITIHSFSNIKSGNYLLEGNGSDSTGGDKVFNFLNTGFPIEDLGFHSGVQVQDPENGGSLELKTSFSRLPNDFYRAFLSSNDDRPRYYYNQEIIDLSEITDIDYSNLPFVENEISIDTPSDSDFLRVRLYGVSSADKLRQYKLLDESEMAIDTLFFQSGIFDNYELNYTLNFGSTSKREYEISRFGEPQSEILSIPSLDGTIFNSELNDFVFESQKNYDFNTTLYLFSDNDIKVFYRYFIYNEAIENLSFSRSTLFDNIMEGTNEISSDQLKFRYSEVISNTSLKGNYQGFIQSVMDNRKEFPARTSIESLKFFE